MKKALKILLLSIPVLIMICLIPIVTNDYLLTLLYIVTIFISLKLIEAKRKDYIVLVFGFFIMILSEYFFISTGVETFTRKTLLGIMPLWLPFLWSYGFVVIKRSTEIL